MGKPDVNFLIVSLVILVDLGVLFGLGVFLRKLNPVKRLAEARDTLDRLEVAIQPASKERLGITASRLLNDVVTPRQKQYVTLRPFLRFQVGRIILILFSAEATVRKIQRELQSYAALVVVLFLVGVIKRAEALESVSFGALRQDIGTHPFDVLDVLALTSISLFLFRLMSELARLDSMLND